MEKEEEEEFTIKINHEEYLNFKYVTHTHFLSYSIPFFSLSMLCCWSEAFERHQPLISNFGCLTLWRSIKYFIFSFIMFTHRIMHFHLNRDGAKNHRIACLHFRSDCVKIAVDLLVLLGSVMGVSFISCRSVI